MILKVQAFKNATQQLSTKMKIGQLFMHAVFINDTEQEIQKTEKLIRDYYIGSLCFFHSRASTATNFESPKKVTYNAQSFKKLQQLIIRYQTIAPLPLLIAIDAEWGLAMRVENTPKYPFAITLGAIDNNAALLLEVGRHMALDCKAAGIHWNLAPVVDINSNAKNPVIGYRSFGESKTRVTTKAGLVLQGMQAEGVIGCLKHFPGHGDTDVDSHLALPVIKKAKEVLLANELYPFKKLIVTGVESIMTAHLAVPSLTNSTTTPCSLSEECIKGLLRDTLNFRGVVVSDALNMRAVAHLYKEKGLLEWTAFEAGNDVLCFSENLADGVTTIYKNASIKMIEESFARVWKLKEKIFTGAIAENKSVLNFKSSSTLNKKIAKAAITLLEGTKEDIASFRNTEYATINLDYEGRLSTDKEILKSLTLMKVKTKDQTHILLNLTPPAIKPKNDFSFLAEEIAFISELINTKKVVLYLFGNPYVLELFPVRKSIATIIAYQNSKEFKEVATNHFHGTYTANGTLPISINLQN